MHGQSWSQDAGGIKLLLKNKKRNIFGGAHGLEVEVLWSWDKGTPPFESFFMDSPYHHGDFNFNLEEMVKRAPRSSYEVEVKQGNSTGHLAIKIWTRVVWLGAGGS